MITSTHAAASLRASLPPDCPQAILDKCVAEQLGIHAARKKYAAWKRKSRENAELKKLNAQTEEDEDGNSVFTFQFVVDKYMARGMDRRTAMRETAKAYPQLHEEFLDGCPAAREPGPN